MVWIRTIAEGDAEGELKSAYNKVGTARGAVANVFKAQSLDPRSLEAHLGLYLSLMFGQGPLSRKQREMIAVVVSAENECGYCVAYHSDALSNYVKNEAWVSELVKNRGSAPLEPKEKAIVNHATLLARNPHRITEQDVEILRREGLSDEEVLQLTEIAAYFNFANCLVHGLGVNLEGGQVSYKY